MTQTPPLPSWAADLTRRPGTERPSLAVANGVAEGDPVTISDPAAFVAGALDYECRKLAEAPEGTRNPRLNTAAFKLGQIIAAGLPLTEDVVYERLEAACEINGLAGDDGLGQCRKSIASGLIGGARQPFAWVQGSTVVAATPFVPPDGTPGVVTTADPHAQAVALEVARQRANREARRLLDEEDGAATFKTPEPRSLRAFLDEPDIAEPFLVADLLPHGANATITAQYKTGKTTMLANLVAALVDREPFLGTHEVVGDPGRVALFDYEMTETQLRRWLREAGIRNVDAVDVVPLRGAGLALDRPQGKSWAVGWLRARRIGVWIVDPFARAYLGDENDNGAVTAWTDALDVIKADAGVHTLVMAVHTGRAQTETARARGATRLDDWPDARWLFTRAADGVRYFSADGRDIDVAEVGLTYRTDTRRYTANLPGRRAAAVGEDAETVFEMLPALGAPGASLNAIAKAFGTKNSSTAERAKRAVEQLIAAGRARRDFKGANWCVWKVEAVPFDIDERP